MITNTELIRRDLAATDHDIQKPKRKAEHETAEKNQAEGQAQANEPQGRKARAKGRVHPRGYPGRDWRSYAAAWAGGKAAK